jgi:hypothetical protein
VLLIIPVLFLVFFRVGSLSRRRAVRGVQSKPGTG